MTRPSDEQLAETMREAARLLRQVAPIVPACPLLDETMFRVAERKLDYLASQLEIWLEP